jgi:hypothetical protein
MDMEAPGGRSVGMSKLMGGGSGSHNKPIGCSASGAYAPGPVEEEEHAGYPK